MSLTGDKDERSGFLSRWSKRKTAAKAEPEELLAAPMDGAAAARDSGGVAGTAAVVPATANAEAVSTNEPAPLSDVETLKFDGDFLPFMAKDVNPALRNQAMKKLFTDPHYGFDNMDKLDIYLDDYSKPDPIPLEMLRGLNQAKRLFLFDDEEKAAPPAGEAGAGSAALLEASTSDESTAKASQDGTSSGPAAEIQSPEVQ